MMHRFRLVLAAALLAAVPLAAQTPAAIRTDGAGNSARSDAVPARTASANTANLLRADKPPVIDGRDDDEVWAQAEAITQFREFQPRIDSTPRFRTEAKVSYDESFIYAFVRAFDPHPDSIVSLLSRRDVRTNSEQIKLMIDAYHDKRSGYEFAVNPAGVKRDYAVTNDFDEDGSWDGVWDVATRIDSLGWTAEFRIPLSQLRYAKKDVHTFGFGIWRDVARYGERYSWPLYDQRRNALMAQLGEVRGITGLGSPRRLEILPYTVAKSATRVLGTDENGIENQFDTRQEMSGGADIKYGLTSNLTLDATINPDFGQVEADPAQVQLNAAELFLTEQRPFFVEGAGVFRFRVGGNNGLFYSRRVGRAPSLASEYGDENTPVTSTILGAAKLTGRLQSGLTVGILNAATQKEHGARDDENRLTTVEPFTNYFVARLSQDFRQGRSGIGFMGTSVNRSLDDFTEPFLRSDAYAAGLDFRHKFDSAGSYEMSGFTTFSHVRGSAEAILATQENFVHQYQRPDDGLEIDADATSLSGNASQIAFGKFGGGMNRFEVYYRRITPGFEINDAGFLNRADEQQAGAWYGLQFNNARGIYRRAQLNFNQFHTYTAHGLRTQSGGNVNGWMELKNQWQVNGGIEAFGWPGTYNDRSAQGGRAVRRSQWYSSWQGFSGDPRKAIVPYWNSFVAWGDEGRSTHFELAPMVEVKAGGRFSASLQPIYFRMDDHTQQYFFGGPEEFGTIDYRQLAMRTRMNFTATPNLSLQVYAEPFISSIDFSDLRIVGDPRAKDIDDRYIPMPGDVEPFDYTQKQLRMNSVIRWEYRPGSTLFFVWSQNRDDAYGSNVGSNTGLPSAGSFSPGRDYRTLFERHPKNTFMIKASYWLSL